MRRRFLFRGRSASTRSTTSRHAWVWYDSIGNGKTALKFNLYHYLDAATNDSEYTSNSPVVRLVRMATRNWGDRNNNNVIDCDIMNFAANGECPALTGDALTFGGVSGNLTQVNPETLHGWGVRQHDWQYGITLQQQVIPRVSAEVAYNRRWFYGEKVTDNTLRGPGDDQPFTIQAPQDPRLPGGGGYPIALSMVTAAAANRGAQNYTTFETDFGPERTNYWHGVDVTLNARLRPAWGRRCSSAHDRPWSVLDSCATANLIDTAAQATIKDLRSCHDAAPFQTTIRGLASYMVPKVDVLVSATVRSQPPLALSASWAVPNTVIQSITGWLPPGGLATGNTTIAILDADHRLYADNRKTQIDMRFAKIFRFGRRRADLGIDLANLLNTNYATTYESNYQYSVGNTAQGGTWNDPTAIYTPRFVRWNLTVNF